MKHTHTVRQPLLSSKSSVGLCESLCNWKIWLCCLSLVTGVTLVVCNVLNTNGAKQWIANEHRATSFLSDERVSVVTMDDGISEEGKSDLITYLPGLLVDINDLNYNMYSGYVQVANLENDGVDDDVKKEIFYWFFEADTDDKDDQPLFFWTNGGPGCSGMDGLLTEHGPLLVNNKFELYVNDYAWNNYVNIVYMEQPFGVGFSVPGKGQVISGDNKATQDIDSFIRNFLIKYPKYLDNDIYISSESWGGHYMPLTAWHILNNNAAGASPNINFKGIMLGNPYTEYYENWIGFMEALYGHGLMKQSVYETWRSHCYGQLPDLTDAVCILNYIGAFIDAIGVDWYALDFPDCTILERDSPTASDASGASGASRMRKMMEMHGKRIEKLYEKHRNDLFESGLMSSKMKEKIEDNLSKVRGASGEISYYACVDDFMDSYLNKDEVQTALHAKKTSWAMCSDDVYYAWPDTDWINGMQTVYQSILNDFQHINLNILLYSGDDDSICGTPGTQYWLRRMGWTVPIDEDWKEWRFNQQLAGYYTRFETSHGKLALYLQTVRSAGHMVPTTQPKRSLELLNRFLNFYNWD